MFPALEDVIEYLHTCPKTVVGANPSRHLESWPCFAESLFRVGPFLQPWIRQRGLPDHASSQAAPLQRYCPSWPSSSDSVPRVPQVTMDLVKAAYSKFIEWDLQLYDSDTDTPARASK